jgi:anaerobic selenocysteine-containing dehydrogenase
MAGAPASAQLRTTCPRDCYDACGALVLLRPGKRPLVRGDPDDPVSRGKLCRKCSSAYNGALLDPGQRLLFPMRRCGPKGEGAFRRITWDEAIGEIASRLSDILGGDPATGDGNGASVLNAHYTGTFAMIGYHFPLRFFNRIGATEVDPDTICNKAGHVALEYLYGTSLEGFDPRAAVDAASILVWGANPSASAPHQHEHWLSEASCPVVVVDPIRTETARAADLHLQLRPGSDAVLAFALLHVLERDGLVDEAFVAEHTVGYDELLPELRRLTPAEAERETGVPSQLIEEAAHIYGAGPSLLWIGQGLQRQPTGGNIVRSVALLPAVTGAVGRPGGGFLYLNGIETRGLDGDYLAGSTIAPGPAPAVSHMDLAGRLEDRERARALFCWNINIAASNPEQTRLRAALGREDLFTVVVDLYQTDTADFADLLLPAASFLEHDDLVVSYFNHSLGSQLKAVEPLGESLTNSEIFRRLAEKMGFEEPELHESDGAILERLLEQSGCGLDFAALSAIGQWWPSGPPRLQFEGLSFPTPSGRVELASAVAERDGFGRVPRAEAEPAPPPGHFRLLSPASKWTLNHSYANERLLRPQLGDQSVLLSRHDAGSLGLVSGDVVTVRSDAGELVVPVVVSDDVPPSVAMIPKGRWPKLEPGSRNVNVLNPGRKSDMAESSSVHGIEVTIEPVRERAERSLTVDVVS